MATSRPAPIAIRDTAPSRAVAVGEGELATTNQDRRPSRSGVTLRLGTLIVTCVAAGAFSLGVGLRVNPWVASLIAVLVAAVLAAVSRSR
jgi:hypothetical protein